MRALKHQKSNLSIKSLIETVCMHWYLIQCMQNSQAPINDFMLRFELLVL